MTTPNAHFKQRILRGDVLIGTFVKTPSMMVSEVLAQTELDVMCLDAEHSPFDRRDLDACLLAYKAQQKPALVRVPSIDHILNALDCGASGVVVPHVDSLEKARRVAKAGHFGAGGRGYAGSTRSAEYATRTLEQNRATARAETVVIAQIEDLGGVEDIERIAAVDGIDCLFIGMMDLTVAANANSPGDERVTEMAIRVCAAAQAANRRTGIFVTKPEEIDFWKKHGVSLFLLQSDHVFIQRGAAALSQVCSQYT